MKIYCVTQPFLSQVKSLFSEHTVELLPDKWSDINADLIVFTGGEDISPQRYGMKSPPAGWFNLERDAEEFSAFSAIIGGKLKTKKVLGICRGLQLINVAFGGILHYDIFTTFGVEHGMSHPLDWLVESPLRDILPVVNSMHHQGIRTIGESLNYKIMAKEPKTGVIEAILWRDRYFAVQFHPEMMGAEKKKEFSSVITQWIKGQISLCSEKKIQNKSVLGNSEGIKWKISTNTDTVYQINPTSFNTNSDDE